MATQERIPTAVTAPGTGKVLPEAGSGARAPLPRSNPVVVMAAVVLVLIAIGLLGLVVVTPLDMRSQAILAATLFGFALLLSRFRGRFVTLALVALSITVSSRYLCWRISATLARELTAGTVVGCVLLGAELYAFVVMLLGYFQLLEPLRRKPVPLPDDASTWPSVDVFIPTYNEPLDVVRATVLAARAMDWPADKLNVYLLDDGRRPEFRAFAARVGVSYLIRPDNKHAKAGNLNHALTRTRGDLIAIFDCDHVPTRSFLQMTVGLMVRDARLAMVQTPHHFYSPDPFERNTQTFRRMPNEGELFYGLIQPGNDLWDAAFFCGSCAVLRRSALEEVGGIAVETVTEDAHTMLKLHRRGHSSAFLDIPLAAGLATESLSAHVGQRIRWARGMAQIFRLDNPFLGRGLTLAQRFCYASSMLHFFYGLPRIVFLLSPLSFLIFGAQIFNAIPLLVLSYSLPHLFHSLLTNSRMQRSYRYSFWSEVYETTLAFYVLIPTTLALIAPRIGTFNVTAKGGLVDQPFFSKRIAAPYIVLTAINLVGLAFGIARIVLYPSRDLDVVLMNMLWTGYNLVILGATLAVAWEQRQQRTAPRVPTPLAAMVRLASGHVLRARATDLSIGGGALVLRHDPPLAAGDAISLALVTGRGERVVPATVVAHEKSILRVQFDELSSDEESALVEAVFSRADAWVNWGEGRKPDFPPRALKDVIVQALRAFALAAFPRLRRNLVGAGTAGKIVALALAFVLAGQARAEESHPGRGPVVPPSATPAAALSSGPRQISRFSFEELGFGDNERAHDTRSTITLPLPSRSDRVLVAATVQLEIAPGGLDPALAGLELLLGGERVALLDARALGGAARHQIAIPPALVEGQTSFALRAIVTTVACDGGVPEGTWRFLAAGSLELQGTPLRLPDDLGSLPLPFYDAAFDRQTRDARVQIAFLHEPTPEHVRIMALIASWLGVQGQEHARFDVSVGALPTGHAIVLADGATDAAALGLAAPEGPVLRMMNNPTAGRADSAGCGKLLVLAGRNLAEVAAAAATLTGSGKLTGAAMALPMAEAAGGISPLSRAAASATPRWVAARDVVPLGDIPGGKDLVHEGARGGTLKLRFRLPPDLFFWLTQSPHLELAYDQVLPRGIDPPRVNVELNGHHLGTLPAPRVRSGQARDHVRLAINRDHLAGYNELLIHLDYGKASCAGGSDGGDGTRFVVDGGASRFGFEGHTHFASLPDLSLFVHDGFPFTRRADLGETIAVLPPRPQATEIGTLLSLVAGFAAVTGQPSSGLVVSAATDLLGGTGRVADLLVVGAVGNQPLLRAFGPQLPVLATSGGVRLQRPAAGWIDLARFALAGRLFDGELARADEVAPALGHLAAVIAIESPLAAGRTAVFVTAGDAADMPTLAALQGHAESRYRGSDVLLVAGQGQQSERWMFRIGLPYENGGLRPWHAFLWRMSQHWVSLFPAALLGILLLGLVLRRALLGRVRRRLFEIGEVVP